MRGLVPAAAVVEAKAIQDHSAQLAPEELALVAGAVPSRHLEFSTGRACAHKAMGALGVSLRPLLRRPDRAPAWPAGTTGSISHAHGIGIAAVASRREVQAIGIDIERLGGVDGSLYALICGPQELAAAGALPGPMAATYATLIFSGKESLYKCRERGRPPELGFADVQLEVSGCPGRSGTLRASWAGDGAGRGPGISSAAGRWALCGDYVLTAFHLPGRSSDAPGSQAPFST